MWAGDQDMEGFIALAEVMEYHSNSTGRPLKIFMQGTDY